MGMNRKLWKLWPIEAINKIEELEAVIAEQTASIAELEKQLPDKRNSLENTIFDARAKVFDVISVEIATKKGDE
jgi:ABC-type Fe3+-citrate transport system substrate-binding protein